MDLEPFPLSQQFNTTAAPSWATPVWGSDDEVPEAHAHAHPKDEEHE